jgi:hypothetical protein
VPPLQALAALHGFWIVLAVPLTLTLCRHLAPRQLRLLGAATAGAAAVGLLVFIGWDLTTWLETVPEDFRVYSFERILFTIGTNPNVPLMPLAVAGVVCWIMGALGAKRETASPSRPFPSEDSLL